MRKETEIPLLSRRKRRETTQGTARSPCRNVQKKAAADERAAFINAFFILLLPIHGWYWSPADEPILPHRIPRWS